MAAWEGRMSVWFYVATTLHWWLMYELTARWQDYIYIVLLRANVCCVALLVQQEIRDAGSVSDLG